MSKLIFLCSILILAMSRAKFVVLCCSCCCVIKFCTHNLHSISSIIYVKIRFSFACLRARLFPFFTSPLFIFSLLTSSNSIWHRHRYNTPNIISNNSSSIIIRSLHSRVLWLEVVREISKIH